MAGLHNLFHPTILDGSTWSKFGACGEHGDVFLFSNLGALWFSENLIRYSLHVCLREVKNNLFSFKHSLFTAFLMTVLKILTYALVSTWSLVSSRWEHVKRKMQPCLQDIFLFASLRRKIRTRLMWTIFIIQLLHFYIMNRFDISQEICFWYLFQISLGITFYRTRVRSLVMLVTNSLPP